MKDLTMPSYLQRQNAPRLAYNVRPPKNPSLPHLIFLTGLASDMMGSKAQFLDGVCDDIGAGYVRFDFRGHGQSDGRFEDGTIGLWCDDASDMIDFLLQEKPVILVGSSMGGWVALLLARLMRHNIVGLVGLAAAPDFTRDIQSLMNDAQREQLLQQGFFPLPSDYGDTPYMITQSLLDDGEKHCVLDGTLNITCPVRLIQGKKDTDVPWQTAQKLYDVLKTNDKKIIYQGDSDHRLSSPVDLDVLKKTVLSLIGQ